MKMQLIRAATMHEAMDKIVHHLGLDAMIYRTRQGVDGVEVLAGLKGCQPFEDEEGWMEPLLTRPVKQPPETREMQQKLEEINYTLSRLSDDIKQAASASSNRQTVAAQYYQKLAGLGFSQQASQALFSGFIKRQKYSANMESGLLIQMMRKLSIEQSELIDHQGCCAIVGPTGVGKTTTIIKLLTRFIARGQSDQVGVISLDEEDIQIGNKMSHHCHRLNVDLSFARTNHELAQSIKDMKKKSLF